MGPMVAPMPMAMIPTALSMSSLGSSGRGSGVEREPSTVGRMGLAAGGAM